MLSKETKNFSSTLECSAVVACAYWTPRMPNQSFQTEDLNRGFERVQNPSENEIKEELNVFSKC